MKQKVDALNKQLEDQKRLFEVFGTGLVDSKVITQFKTQNKPGLDYLDDMSDLSDSDESPDKEDSPDISPEKSPEKPPENEPENKENEEEEKDPSFQPSADLFGETEKRLNDTLKKGTAPIPKPKS